MVSRLDQENDLKTFDQARRFYALVAAQFADRAATAYENRGQIEQAVTEWAMAASLRNKEIDSKACQALLKSVNADDAQRLSAQIQWADTHGIKLDDDWTVRFRPYDGQRRITIGYVCCWWDSSTIRGQAIPFISQHDRSRFKIVGYSLGSCDESITRHFDEFIDVSALTDVDFALRVRADEVDALVEFTGFSPNHRYGAMNARCAPVQVSYLNHTGTSGVANVDYVLADPICAGKHLDEYYTEEIWRMPAPFFNFNYDWDEFPDAGAPPCLETGVVTFGCFGSQSKINDAQIMIWAELLHRVPESRLFLRNMGLSEPFNRAFMERRFLQWGIGSGRLQLEAGGTRQSILASYSQVDISLDTWPYNGGNTIAESTWLGVPTITLAGGSFPSAYGASLLTGCGLEDLVARSPEELYEIASRLATDKERLVYLRKHLREMMFEHGFADSQRFAQNMEEAIVSMVERAVPAGTGRPS